MGRAKPPPKLTPKGDDAAAGKAGDTALANQKQEGGAGAEDLPIQPGKTGAGGADGAGSSSAAVAAGTGPSQLSLLLGKPVLQAPVGGLPLDDSGGEKRGPLNGPLGNVDPPRKVRKVLNRESVRAIVHEEAELARTAYREDLATALGQALSGESFRKVVREEVRAALGLGPSESLHDSVGEMYTEALRTGITDAMRKLGGRGGFPADLPRTDPVAVAKWSSLEASLDTLEKLVKSRADADVLREAKNSLLDLKNAVEGLRVNGTSTELKVDQLRSLLTSLPPPQTFAQQPSNFASTGGPWQQYPNGLSAAPPRPEQTPPANFTGQSINPAAQGNMGAGPSAPANAARGPDAIATAPQNRRAPDNDYPKEQLLAIRSTNLNRSLPSTSQGMVQLLGKAEYPENAINSAVSYIPLKAKPLGTFSILTFKACYPNPAVRSAFLALAKNERVAKMLDALEVSIEEWKDKADMMLERDMRYSTNIARSAETDLAAQFSQAASAFRGPR